MIICICGPTGVGKTRVSEFIAEKLNGIIINADATQIYKNLNIGSAKITKEEMKVQEHYLFDIKSPNEDYSVMNYQNDARKILNKNKNKNIIVVGGTGLYIKSLFYDYKFFEKKEENYDNLTNHELYLLAKQKDENCSLHENNRVRLINFLNRERQTFNKDKLLYNVIFIGLTTERKTIYSLCDKRVDNMMKKGLLKEATYLYKKYPESKILKRAIGYKELIEYLNGNETLENAIENIKKNTRHYVKRQYTWFNNQLNLNWFNIDIENFSKTENEIYEFIKKTEKDN